MKFAKWSVILLLSASLWGQTAPKAKAAGRAKKRVAAVAVKKTTAKAVTASEIQNLRDSLSEQQRALTQQQQQIQQLREELARKDESIRQAAAAASEAQTRVTAVETKASEAAPATAVETLKSDVADLKQNQTNAAVSAQDDQKRVEAAEGQLGRFRFSGDVRVRQEDFFQKGTQGRMRERIRLRFGVESKLNEDFLAGIFIASGAITDPTSTNETLTSAFERKTVSFDRGYIIYQPQAHPWLQLTGGKFAYTWIRTPQSFDNDLNPEGFSEKFSFNLKNDVVKNVTFTGMQLLFNEVSAAAASSNASCLPNFQFCANSLNTTGADSFAAGGQVSAKLQLGKRWTATPSYSVLNWRNENSLLNQPASVTGGTGITVAAGSTLPVVSLSSAAFAPNGLTNATVKVGTTANGAPILALASKFLYSDFILDNTFATGHDRWPVRLLLEYLNNLNAVKISPVLGKQSHLYKAEATFGQLKKRNDLQFSYGFWRQEQDSVLAAFNESDQRAPTNVVQHSLSAQWLVRDNVTAAFTLWDGRTLNTNLVNAKLAAGVKAGQQDPYLKRMQFDVIYKF